MVIFTLYAAKALMTSTIFVLRTSGQFSLKVMPNNKISAPFILISLRLIIYNLKAALFNAFLQLVYHSVRISTIVSFTKSRKVTLTLKLKTRYLQFKFSRLRLVSHRMRSTKKRILLPYFNRDTNRQPKL